MKKSLTLIILLACSMAWAEENLEARMQQILTQWQQLAQKIDAYRTLPPQAQGICLLPTGLPMRAKVYETRNRFEWSLLPEYYYDYSVDSSTSPRSTQLDYSPIDDVFYVLPALYGLWMSEPQVSLISYQTIIISAAKSVAGASYQELINKSETFYYGIPGIEYSYKMRSSYIDYIWYAHILWKDGIGYYVFFLTRESAYRVLLNQSYFKAVLTLVNFSSRAAVANPNYHEPGRFLRLEPNYPNPFNAGTNISYHLEQPGAAQLNIFNTLGQIVRTFQFPEQAPGNNQIQWDGRNDQGEMVPSGIYFYQLQYGTSRQVRQMTLIK